MGRGQKGQQSQSIICKLLEMPHYKEARSICLYLSLSSEVDTATLVKDVFQYNKKCYIPRYYTGSRKMDMVLVNSQAEIDSLPLTDWGIRQPLETEDREDALTSGVELVIVP